MKKENKNKDLQTLRHSASHVLAQAVLQMFPDAKLGIGPAIEDGFYYDFDLPRTLIPEDLPILEEKMRKIIKANLEIKQEKLSQKKALEFLKKIKQPYKLELAKEIPDKELSFYRQGDFVDLCAGPHIDSTGEIKAFKLLKIAGAYWRGSEKKPMLQRIYGTAFYSKKELDEFLKMREEAEKRDHKKMGQKLNLFSISEEIGSGLPIWHPNGAIIREQIENFWKEEHKNKGYEYVYSPHIGKLDLWKRSGHWDFYRENMYSPIKIENKEYLLKPMNCLFHIFIFQSKLRSYKELPIRYCELGTVYRYERSGVLHGLTRVRGFTQDDAHIFCAPEQLEEEIINVIKFADFMMKTFNFKYKVYLSTRPEKSLGTDKDWKIATKSLENALKKTKTSYDIDPGEGIFYGPKIDIKLEDSIDREWQGPTIQVDFNFPEKFNVNYIDKKGRKKKVIMVHRTVLGSMERFIGCLIEHFSGAFPIWLSPIQVKILNVGKAHEKYALQIKEELEKNNIRAEIDLENKTMGKKIRDAELQKIPYMLVVGDKEMKEKTINVRNRQGKQTEEKIDKFIKDICAEIKEKK